ncbi:caspase-8-like [Heptranchias perlo]|uniref:caspase-8-like n=1 Tax=Heptranchias perlo TaxID=212740 RepID=UPI00355A1952
MEDAMEFTDLNFLALLNNISDNLGSYELKAVKFLCRDLVSSNRLGSADSGHRLFSVLQEQGLLQPSDSFFVAELLYRVKQFRLLKRMNYDKHQVCKKLTVPGNARISSYRQFLFELSEDITTRQLAIVKHFLHKYLSKSKLENITTMLDALIEMEKEGLLEEDNMELLEYICKQVGEDLVQKFEDYRQDGSKLSEEPALVSVPTRETHTPPRILVARGTQPAAECLSRQLPFAEESGPLVSLEPHNSLVPFSQLSVSEDQQTTVQDATMSHTMIDEGQDKREQKDITSHSQNIRLDSEFQSLGSYKMESVPRGYCVIINNSTFQNLRARRGTDVDAEQLEWTFTWLGFTVTLFNNLSAAEIREKMDCYQQKDHTHLDCFICCILTHGEKGVMYGTDGQTVAIRDITSRFSASQCCSLRQKPKLFFIQACQGSKKHESVVIEADSASTWLEEDAVNTAIATIPDEADFLLGMATVEGYVSFRHVKQGTWYIQSLCENLKRYCASEDLLSILTIVNRDVSERKDREYKTQMPQPSYTLRKKLYFPVAQSFAHFRNSP